MKIFYKPFEASSDTMEKIEEKIHMKKEIRKAC